MPLVRGESDEFASESWGVAVDRIAEATKDKKVGVIAGGHLTTEDAYAISKLARGPLGTADIDSRIQDAGAPYELALDTGPVAGSTATIENLKAAKTIVWVGPDPKETLPVLYLHLHTTVREGDCKLVVLSPRTTSLDVFAGKVIRTGPDNDGLADLKTELGDGDAVFCWSPSSIGRDDEAFVRSYFALAAESGAKLLVCPPHAGSQGMIDMGVHPALDSGYRSVETAGRDTRAMLQAAADGELDALFIFGADVIADFPDAGLARHRAGERRLHRRRRAVPNGHRSSRRRRPAERCLCGTRGDVHEPRASSTEAREAQAGSRCCARAMEGMPTHRSSYGRGLGLDGIRRPVGRPQGFGPDA